LVKPIKSLKKRYQDSLRAQTITEESPGTILKDFATLLDFIGPEGIETSGKYGFLPLRLLPELNARLRKPVALDLKRPQQKSYPPIHGLYLLLRASGLAYVQRRGKKDSLQLDQQGLASWYDLNPTERYFTLLETWMLRADPSILGERGLFASGDVRNWQGFFQRYPDQSLQVAGNKAAESSFPYTPTFCTLALLDLFGIVTVEYAKPEPGKGCRVARVEHTGFGDAMTHLLFKGGFFFDLSSAELEDDEEPDKLRARLAPFFPEWRHRLVLSKPERVPGVYIFKASLGSIWARIAVPSESTLDELSTCILNAYEFDFDHLYQFSYANRFGIVERVNHPYMDESPWTDEVAIGDLGLKPGAVMTYLYDFGDNWEFEVLLERIEPLDTTIQRGKLLEFHGESPSQYGDFDEE
jgi:hypothetical protein